MFSGSFTNEFDVLNMQFNIEFRVANFGPLREPVFNLGPVFHIIRCSTKNKLQ